MHRSAGDILYKYRMSCCACSDPFPIVLPQLFQGSETMVNYICADWSTCWAMATGGIFILVCVCFLFIQKFCLPLENPAVLFLENESKIQQIFTSSNPDPGVPAVQQLPQTLSGYSTTSCAVQSDVMECYRLHCQECWCRKPNAFKLEVKLETVLEDLSTVQ